MHSLLLYVCLSLLSGILTGLPLLFNFLAPLSYLAMTPYFVALVRSFDERSAKRTLSCSFLFGLSYNLTAFGWISEMHPLDFTGMSNFASLAVCYGGSLLLSAIYALPFMLFGYLLRLAYGTEIVKKRKFLLIPLAASLWTLLEAVQEIGDLAVPWARLAVGQASYSVLIGSASIFGCLFVGAVIVAFNMFLALIPSAEGGRRKAAFASTAAIVLLVSVTLSIVAPLQTEEKGTVDIAVIQGNIPTNEKWDDPSISVDTYISMLESIDGDAPDIVFIPETAVTFDITASPARLQRIKAFAYKNECTVLFGTYMFDENGDCYNTVREVDESGLTDSFYAKRKLVPFGEYLPFSAFFSKVAPDILKLDMFSEMISAGDSPFVFSDGDARIGALVCFDSLFPSLSRGAVLDGANLMFIATNDGWFSETYAVNIHNSIATVRSVETGRYYIRAANTGISSVIAPTGKYEQLLPANERGIIRCDVPLIEGNTLYMTIGNLFVWICLAYVISFFIFTIAMNIASKKRKRRQ